MIDLTSYNTREYMSNKLLLIVFCFYVQPISAMDQSGPTPQEYLRVLTSLKQKVDSILADENLLKKALSEDQGKDLDAKMNAQVKAFVIEQIDAVMVNNHSERLSLLLHNFEEKTVETISAKLCDCVKDYLVAQHIENQDILQLNELIFFLWSESTEKFKEKILKESNFSTYCKTILELRENNQKDKEDEYLELILKVLREFKPESPDQFQSRLAQKIESLQKEIAEIENSH